MGMGTLGALINLGHEFVNHSTKLQLFVTVKEFVLTSEGCKSDSFSRGKHGNGWGE